MVFRASRRSDRHSHSTRYFSKYLNLIIHTLITYLHLFIFLPAYTFSNFFSIKAVSRVILQTLQIWCAIGKSFPDGLCVIICNDFLSICSYVYAICNTSVKANPHCMLINILKIVKMGSGSPHSSPPRLDWLTERLFGRFFIARRPYVCYNVIL